MPADEDAGVTAEPWQGGLKIGGERAFGVVHGSAVGA
jgi:hypothetical protein